MASSTIYWNEAVETQPWDALERWQAGQIAAALPGLRQRSALYADLHAGVPTDVPLRSLADLQALPFTLKSDIRQAQDAANDAQPLGYNQAADTADIVQCISSSGTTGQPLYYGLTQADVERFTDAIAHT